MRGRRLRNRTSWKENCHGWVPEILNFWCIHSPFILGHPNDLTNPFFAAPWAVTQSPSPAIRPGAIKTGQQFPRETKDVCQYFRKKKNINKSTVAASTSFLFGLCCFCSSFCWSSSGEPSPAHSFQGFGSCWLLSTRFSSRIVHHSFTKVPPGHSRSSPASSASGRVLGRCSFQLERFWT